MNAANFKRKFWTLCLVYAYGRDIEATLDLMRVDFASDLNTREDSLKVEIVNIRDTITDKRLKEWKTLDKCSVQLIPANGKQSDNKGQTSSTTVTDGQTDGQTELVS